jgi:hypothetical protein
MKKSDNRKKVLGLIVFFWVIVIVSLFIGVVSVGAAQDIIIDTEKGVPGFRTEPARDLPANWQYVQDHPDTSADGWFDTNAYPPGQGNGSFWYTISFPDMGKCKGIWGTSVPYAGKYEVFVWIPSPDPFDPYLDEATPPSDYLPTKRAQYKVFHNDGVATVTIDQNEGGFTSLGVFVFDSTARVELSSNGVEFWRCVAFDAVKFVPVVNDMAVTKIDGDNICVSLKLLNIPSTLVFNQDFVPDNSLEYEWGIYIDLDNNPSTGSSYPEGCEVSISLVNFKFPGSTQHTDTIIEGTQHNTWIFNGGWQYGHAIDATVDYSANTIKMIASKAWEELSDFEETDRFCFLTSYQYASGEMCKDITSFSDGSNIITDLEGDVYGNVNEDIQFYGSGTDPDGDAITAYAWDFNNDGITDSELQDPTHTYSEAGTYIATLKVKDSTEWGESKVGMVFISDSLIAKYAPVVYLHKDEKFYPTEIKALLDYSDLKTKDETIVGPITVDQLMAHNDEDTYLDLILINGDMIKSRQEPDPKFFKPYPINIYAREKTAIGGTALQYWFFYPYNRGKVNAHEGDWEMFQILLDLDEKPYRVTYSWHVPFSKILYGGKTYEWFVVEKEGNTHPKVYVNKGSHANNKEPKLLQSFQIGTVIFPKLAAVLGQNMEAQNMGA